MTVAIDNRIYIAAGIKIYKTKSFFASSESDLININPQPSNWSYDNNEITVIINSRKFDFSNITVSPNATYKVFSDQACANPLSNVVEVPITAAPQGSKTVWLKVTAEDGVGNTVYKIILERYSRSISLTADNNYFYGQYFSPQWRIINPQNLWEGDTFENLGLIIPKITCGGIDPITLLCNKKGTYSITFQDSCNPEYIIDFQITSVNIQPKTIDIDSIDVELSKVYDGKTTAAVKSLKVSNILAKDQDVTVVATASYNSKNVLEANKITVNFSFGKSSSSNDNYVLPSSIVLTQGVKITPKPITISEVSAVNRVYSKYDNTVTLKGGKLEGVLSGDSLGFNLGKGLMADANVGTNKPVTANITLTGAQKDNYQLIQPTYLTVNIVPLPVQVYWEHNSEYVYNAQDQFNTIKAYYLDFDGNKIYLNTKIVSGGSLFKNAGKYVFSAYMSKPDNNYDIGSPSKELTIKPRQIAVDNIQVNTTELSTRRFSNYSVRNILDSDITVSAFASFNNPNVDAKYIIVEFNISGTNKNNYSLPESVIINDSVQIVPRSVLVSWVNKDKYVYNAQDQSGTVLAMINDVNGLSVQLKFNVRQAFYQRRVLYRNGCL
ncbi:MAG TPA: YDG domain-containing protein [Clostridia bacterium]